MKTTWTVTVRLSSGKVSQTYATYGEAAAAVERVLKSGLVVWVYGNE